MTYDNHETALRVIKSLLTQLLYQSEGVPHELMEYYRNKRQPGDDFIRELFEKLQKQFSKIFIVLDALDECNFKERDLLTLELRKFLQKRGCRLCYTARPDVELKLKSQSSRITVLKTQDNDITIFLKQQFERRDIDDELTYSDRTEIINKIVTESQNM